jgi:small subunit ribosomal protein S1
MSSDSSDRSLPPQTPTDSAADAPGSAGEAARRKILIGSQRDPGAYRPKPRHDWKPLVEPEPEASSTPLSPAATSTEQPTSAPAAPAPPAAARPTSFHVEPLESRPAEVPAPPPSPTAPEPPPVTAARPPMPAIDLDELEDEPLAPLDPAMELPAPASGKKFPPPNIRSRLSPELEEELEAALAGASLDDIMSGSDALSKQVLLEADSKHMGRVVAVQRDDVFIELGGREQGVLKVIQFADAQPPQVGATLEVRVVRFNPEEGLYELTLPHAAADIGDWSDLEQGMIVEARVTGHNTGGLECEVNHIRGFIPISQIALYRVENIEQFVGEKFNCLVTEANPQRRNLVLSRRAVLEREKEQARQELLQSLAPGQIREGVVRKLMDFGAFIDLGGVDGLLHISQLAWERVKHPSDVLQEGQRIRVRVEKIDPATGKMSLSYRDLLQNPWTDVERKYSVHSVVRGRVTKIMEFGAFVQLEPGVEGLVHISELAHKRVWRVSDVVKEQDEVDVVVLSIDTQAQRISLSMKAATAAPEPAAVKDKDEEEAVAAEPARPKRPVGPLKGGLGRAAGGEQFGLKW